MSVSQKRKSLLKILLVFLGLTISLAGQDLVRAKIGLKIDNGKKARRCKSFDRAKAGDKVRIYVQPEEKGYMYAVYSDGQHAELLSGRTPLRMQQGNPELLPTPREYYEFDGISKKEYFSVIFSPQKLAAIELLFAKKSVTHAEWKKVEADLEKRSKLSMSDQSDKPFAIAGNVRGIETDPFMKKLQIFSGKSFVLKKYEITVKK